MDKDRLIEKFTNFSKDSIAVLFLLVVGMSIIGYFAFYEFLATGYQDWIYHAFRIRSIEKFGIISWDHKWANGLNYWRSYQYYPHYLALLVKNIFNVSITKSMILLTIFTFIYLRIATYIVLRLERIPVRESLFAVLLTFLSFLQWNAMKDYSIFITLFLMPIFIYFWILSTRENKYYPLTVSIAGFSWLLHPVFGLAATSLISLDVILNKSLSLIKKLLVGVYFAFSSISFWLPYLASGYKFSHPFLESTEFVRMSGTNDLFGLGLIFFFGLFFSWVALIFFSKYLSYWVKVMILHTTLVCGYFFLARQGQLPGFFNVLQFQRSNIFFVFSWPFFFAPALSVLLKNLKNPFLNIVIVSLFAVIFVTAIDMHSTHSAIPMKSLDTNLEQYFNERKSGIEGSIYYSNDSEFSYFSDPEIRLAGSYNEHLLPSPLSSIFKSYMRHAESDSVVTEETVEKISNYITVLGVEYLVVGQNSPIAIETRSGDIEFLEEITTLKKDNDTFSVLKNVSEIYNSYILEKSVLENADFSELENPTLNNSSYIPWNDQVGKLAEILRSDNVVKMKNDYSNPEKIRVNLPQYSDFNDPVLLITNNYSPEWKTNSGKEIEVTSLKFMLVDLSDEENIVLTHSWPKWHWPVQYMGPLSVLLSILGLSIFSIYEYFKFKNK